MASSYGVGVMNRYELFADDESDPLEAFNVMERLREEKKKRAKLADKENETATKTKVAQTRRNQRLTTEKENRRNEPNQMDEKPARGHENRRGIPIRRGKREFDRQSGSDKTGVKPVDKRDGAGSHNWGSHKDLIEEVEQSNDDHRQLDEHVETGEKETEEATAAAIEEKIKQFTLEEWKASRTNRVKPQYNIRKAGEGEDLSQWENMYELNKKAEREEFEDDEGEYDPMDFPQRVGRQKHVRDINFYFNDGRRVGGFRGRGGRGRQRDNNQFDSEFLSEKSAPVPKVDDERVFPSLT